MPLLSAQRLANYVHNAPIEPTSALDDKDFMVETMTTSGDYHYRV